MEVRSLSAFTPRRSAVVLGAVLALIGGVVASAVPGDGAADRIGVAGAGLAERTRRDGW